MKNKTKVNPVARTAKERSEDQFWDEASRERDPAKNLKITEQINKAIVEHEGNVRRKLSVPAPAWSTSRSSQVS